MLSKSSLKLIFYPLIIYLNHVNILYKNFILENKFQQSFNLKVYKLHF
jgi:hypothetical protein